MSLYAETRSATRRQREEEEEEEEEEGTEAMEEEGEEDSEETGLYVPSTRPRRSQYLVHWKGYPSDQDTWEFASDKIDPKTKEPGNLPVEYLNKKQHPNFAKW